MLFQCVSGRNWTLVLLQYHNTVPAESYGEG